MEISSKNAANAVKVLKACISTKMSSVSNSKLSQSHLLNSSVDDQRQQLGKSFITFNLI